jgi:hypothetical protein
MQQLQGRQRDQRRGHGKLSPRALFARQTTWEHLERGTGIDAVMFDPDKAPLSVMIDVACERKRVLVGRRKKKQATRFRETS